MLKPVEPLLLLTRQLAREKLNAQEA